MRIRIAFEYMRIRYSAKLNIDGISFARWNGRVRGSRRRAERPCNGALRKLSAVVHQHVRQRDGGRSVILGIGLIPDDERTQRDALLRSRRRCGIHEPSRLADGIVNLFLDRVRRKSTTNG